jgi:hypothetical protein
MEITFRFIKSLILTAFGMFRMSFQSTAGNRVSDLLIGILEKAIKLLSENILSVTNSNDDSHPLIPNSLSF